MNTGRDQDGGNKTMKQHRINELLRHIENDCRLTKGYTGRSAFKTNVMEAIARVPREEFVPDHLKALSYQNSPLPIGEGQTISQPFIVALMTDLLCPDKSDTMLEVGAGSGYQAAVLSQLVKKLYTVEIVPSLAQNASLLLHRLGYDNVVVQQGDGSLGWPEHAPYDGIIVTAAATEIPEALKQQLKPGGRMVIPVGYPGKTQNLMLIEKDHAGNFTSRNILPVAFVPFVTDSVQARAA